MTVHRAAVATSEIHAARIGAEVLRRGGNAVDAAVATAAALTVCEPTSNGLGGDLFALAWDGSAVHALASSGASPRDLPAEELRRRLGPGGAMPTEGWESVTVPGQVAGWQALHARLGCLPWARLLAPAAALAHDGFEVGPVTAAAWARAVPRLSRFEEWRRSFLPGGRPPAAGERFAHPELGRSLERIAAEGAEALYGGALGRALVDWSRATGGWLSLDDLRAHRALWVEPLRTRSGRHEIVGMTAPTQGVVALEALAILEGLSSADRLRSTHRAIEAVKLAFADADAEVTDPRAMRRPVEALLEPARIARRRARLRDDVVLPPPAPAGVQGGTVLVCAADAQGMVVSLIQSNFNGFGSGIVVPGTGMALQDRAAGFSLRPGHPNLLEAGKRPFHTILPALRAGPEGVGAFGCMGGQMQPQGHVQLVTALAGGAAPQQAIDQPRWRWMESGQLWLERGFDPTLAEGLARLGHDVVAEVEPHHFGGAQALLPADGGWTGGSDPRKDGAVAPA